MIQYKGSCTEKKILIWCFDGGAGKPDLTSHSNKFYVFDLVENQHFKSHSISYSPFLYYSDNLMCLS